jgi:hypothetical protein
VTYSIVAINFDVGDYLEGPHVLPHRLTGNHYRYLLLHYLQNLLEDVPLAVRAGMWYMNDGAPAHFSCTARDVLNNTYHNRWLGRGGPAAMDTMLDRFESSGFLSVGTPKYPCTCSSC